MYTYLLLFTILIIILLLILNIILYTNENQLQYILWKSLNMFSDKVRIKIYNSLIKYIMLIKNYNNKLNNKDLNNIKSNNIIKIPKKINKWYNKLIYCKEKDGYIDDINYDDLLLSSKSTVTLY